MTEWEQRVYALAAMCQAAACIQQLAHRGEVIPVEASSPLINAILAIDAASIEDIYAIPTGINTASLEQEQSLLHIGLNVFKDQFLERKSIDKEQVELVINMARLERLLNGNDDALKNLGAGVTQVARQKNEFNVDTHRIMENLAGLYSDFISPLSRPIHVKGKPEMLKQTPIQNQIRTLLLAGIRSAVLWRQVGGKKRHFIFNRSTMLNAANSLLSTSSYMRSQ